MSGRIISRRSVLALAACTALGAVGCSKTEEYTGPELILRYAENQPEDYPTTQAALAFADLVAERTEGRVKVVVYSGGELGAEQSVIEQMQYGGHRLCPRLSEPAGRVSAGPERIAAAFSLYRRAPDVAGAGR